jgi:alkylated DNA nucleotide flippase Atl1
MRSGELVFTVDGAAASPATPVSLAEAGLKERSDLQEWVLAHPEILGAGVLVVTFEFDRWLAGTGAKPLDRLDVLGLDTDGRLVVVELKRDKAPDTVDMQAVKYAAMASRFTEDTLVEQYVKFLGRAGEAVDEDAARAQLAEHAGELDLDQLRRPRIVLVAGAFPPSVTATAVWLSEMGLDITLIRVQAYRVADGQTIITVSQVFPVPDIEDFTVSPQRAQVQAVEERRRQGRERSTVIKLVASGAVPEGTELTLRPTTEVGPEVREQIEAWVAEDPNRGKAIWHNHRRGPLEWLIDGERYRPTALVAKILAEAAATQRSVRGPAWWTVPDGRDLPTVAGSTTPSAFDWSDLHSLLGAVPEGRWVSYGDLADVVGTAAMPLGQHLAKCGDCDVAYRVLGEDGKPRKGFTWSDPTEARSVQEVLAAEGVPFKDGVASPTARLSVDELLALRANSLH